mmetsp:Transcript_18438/g.60281  ORF Transcript_18438/g.60281 Transcript_18438/m.60281 type:complete len:159 (+) Transcript_18438:2-478(+)
MVMSPCPELREAGRTRDEEYARQPRGSWPRARMPKSVPKLWAPKLTNVFGSKTKVTHLGDTEMCDDGPQRDHEEDVNHEPRNSKSLRDGQSLVVPQHAGAPFIAPTRIFVAPKAEAPADAVITMGICLLVEFMMAPADAEEPPQLRAFWSEVGVFSCV